MIHENNVTLIVMVTQLVERGRQKCHKYWPELDKTEKRGNLSVKMTLEKEVEKGVVERHFELVDDQNRTRSIQQLQFVNWPDHGVPNDPSDFVDFVMRVNSIKNEQPEQPTLVHCSAGVGRTGQARK